MKVVKGRRVEGSIARAKVVSGHTGMYYDTIVDISTAKPFHQSIAAKDRYNVYVSMMEDALGLVSLSMIEVPWH